MMAYQLLRIPRPLRKTAMTLADRHSMHHTIDREDDTYLYITFRGPQKGILAIIKATQSIEAKVDKKLKTGWYS